MTIAAMHRGVKLCLDKNSYLPIPSFEPEEIDFWINKTQGVYADKCIELLTNPNVSNDEKKKCQEILSPFYKFLGYQTVDIVNYTTLSANAWRCPSTGLAPTNTRRITDVYIKINRVIEDGTSVTAQNVPCQFIPITEINKYMKTIYNEVYFELPVYTFVEYSSTSKGLLIFVDSKTTSVTALLASYFENPPDVDINTLTNSEFPESVHQKIVDLTVTLMLENIESERIKTQPVINNTL